MRPRTGTTGFRPGRGSLHRTLSARPPMKTPLPLVLATLLVVSGGTAELSAQSITLDFGWIPGAATVTATSNVTAGVMGQSTEIDSSTGYRLAVTEDAGGLHLSYSDFTFNGSNIEERGRRDERPGRRGHQAITRFPGPPGRTPAHLTDR